jgi:hypothetical protein
LSRGINLLINNWSLALLGIVLATFSIVVHENEKRAESNVGVLRGQSIATEKSLAIGGIRIVMATSNDVVVRDDGEPVLSVSVKNSRLYVSTIIRAENGDLLAEIRENEWKVNTGRFDRNYTDNALEVRDAAGKLVLQVVNFGDVVHFAGTFHTKKGNAVSFVPLEDRTALIEIAPSIRDSQVHIDPVFEYSSELHLGSCPGMKRLEDLVRSGTSHFYFTDSIDIGKQARRAKRPALIKLI